VLIPCNVVDAGVLRESCRRICSVCMWLPTRSDLSLQEIRREGFRCKQSKDPKSVLRRTKLQSRCSHDSGCWEIGFVFGNLVA
jgi:hypothetical protein